MGIIQNDLSIRLEYLNNTAYLFYPEYGWWDDTNNRPTDKLLTIIKQNDKILKNRWGTLIPNESFIYPDLVPAFEVVIPTYWDIINNEYPKSNGIGYGKHLELIELLSWENIDELYNWYIPKNSFLDDSNIPTDIPNDQFINYIPILEAGYAFINDAKIYVFPNKVVIIIKAESNKNLYNIDTSIIANNHPVFIYKNETMDYNTIKTNTLKHIELIENKQFKTESIQYNNTNETATVGIIQPYIQIQVIDDTLVPIELSYTSYKLMGNQLTNIIKDYDYINMKDNFLYIHEPFDGIIALIFNKKGYDRVIVKNVDASPITWKSDDRMISIIDGYKEPYSISIISTINIINNTDIRLPINIILEDNNGVPIKDKQITLTEDIQLSTVNGNISDAVIDDIIYNGKYYYKISNIPIDTEIIMNSSTTIGKIHNTNEYLIISKQIDIPEQIVTTNKYGSVNTELNILHTYEPISNTIHFITAKCETYTYTHKITIINNNIYPHGNIGYLSTEKTLTEKSIKIMDINNNTIQLEDKIYGGYVRLYTIPDWNDNIDNYIHVPAYNDEITTIDTSQITGTYVVVYDKILPTWSVV